MAEFSSYPSGTPSWVDLQSPDIAAAVAFYSTLFGWEAMDMGPDAGGYMIFTKGGKRVAGVGPQMMEGAPPAWVTYVSVDDIDATAAAIAANGGTVFAGPMDVMTAGKLAIGVDPLGGVFALWQPLEHIGAELANEHGTFTWSELHSRDTEKAATFYGAIFGWTGKTEDFGGMPYTQFFVGDHEVGGMMGMEAEAPEAVGAYWNTYFGIDDADAAVATATGLGAAVIMPPTDTPVGRLAIIQDPQGARFSLIQAPSAA